MAPWALALSLFMFRGVCPVPAIAPGASMDKGDVVQVFAGYLHHGQRITIGLMDNQKLKGEFLGVIHDRLVLRPDRDRPGGTLPIRFRAIHSIEAQRGGQVERPR